MSSAYQAIEQFDFSVDRVYEVIKKLNENCCDFEGANISWQFDSHIKDENDILKEIDSGYLSIFCPQPMNTELLITRSAIAVSDLTGWKWLLYQETSRKLAFAKCERVAACVNLDNILFVPDSTFLDSSPVDMFVSGESYEKIKLWTEENMDEIFSFVQFEGQPKHHDVYFSRKVS